MAVKAASNYSVSDLDQECEFDYAGATRTGYVVGYYTGPTASNCAVDVAFTNSDNVLQMIRLDCTQVDFT